MRNSTKLYLVHNKRKNIYSQHKTKPIWCLIWFDWSKPSKQGFDHPVLLVLCSRDTKTKIEPKTILNQNRLKTSVGLNQKNKTNHFKLNRIINRDIQNKPQTGFDTSLKLSNSKYIYLKYIHIYISNKAN